MNRSDAAKAGKPAGAAQEVGEIVKTVFWALLIALVIRTLLFQPYTIPSASEEPNLYQGDYIIVSKWSYGYSRHSILFSPPIGSGRLFFQSPTRGDVVVFKLPRDGNTDYIKRLVGLPGDRIQVRHGQLFINGKALVQKPMGCRSRPTTTAFPSRSCCGARPIQRGARTSFRCTPATPPPTTPGSMSSRPAATS